MFTSTTRQAFSRVLAGTTAASAGLCLGASALLATIPPTLETTETTVTNCEASPSRFQRKQTTLQQAGTHEINNRRMNTRQELSVIRKGEQEMLRRWERDEDGWRELPARAWPAYQPNPKQMENIEVESKKQGCSNTNTSDPCKELLFNIATTKVFYNLDPTEGLRQFENLAKQGHVDSMVACGIILTEGMGVPPDVKKGLEWLKKAVDLKSSQGYYELATVLYTGIDGVVEEDPEGAFELFAKAAEQDHTAGMYMMADCLVEGEGVGIDVARAVPLFYRAAEKGHRYSRQKIRELLAKQEYKN